MMMKWTYVLLLLALAGCENSSNSPVSGTGDNAAGPDLLLVVLSGDGQSGEPGDPLETPITILLTDGQGLPQSRRVDFRVGSGDAQIDSPLVITDALGRASINVTLGSTEGSIEILAEVFSTTTSLTLTATSKRIPWAIKRIGNRHRASSIGIELSEPLAVTVVNKYGEPVGGAEVRYLDDGGTALFSTISSDSGLVGYHYVPTKKGAHRITVVLYSETVGARFSTLFTVNTYGEGGAITPENIADINPMLVDIITAFYSTSSTTEGAHSGTVTGRRDGRDIQFAFTDFSQDGALIFNGPAAEFYVQDGPNLFRGILSISGRYQGDIDVRFTENFLALPTAIYLINGETVTVEGGGD